MARRRGRPRSIDSYPELMRVADVAEYMGLTNPRIYEMVAQGQIPVQRVGRRILISKAELIKRFGLASTQDSDESPVDDEVISAVRELIAQNTQMVAQTARQLEVAERLLAKLDRGEKEKAS